MKFDILTIFPEAFDSYFNTSILARARSKGFIGIAAHNLRKWARDKHQTVDDRPYGGGVGMVMKADVVQSALKGLKAMKGQKSEKIILLTPQGKKFDHGLAKKLSKNKRLVFISGRYEGFDERIRSMVDMEISLGDFVLTGGELPAMTIIDAVSRFVPGVLGKDKSLEWESFSDITVNTPELKGVKSRKSKLLEYPQYTRPESLKVGTKLMRVPKTLLGGNHREVFDWRLKQAEARTAKRRPDLIG